MPVCWSLDKVGPMCRSVEDCAIVFNAIYGPDGQVALSAELIDAETRKPVWEGQGADSAQVSVGEVSSVVAQLNRAAESSVGKLAAGLDAFLRSGAARPSP
jgi:Asp-tRNA(Asn)/Glu-tRNA(Gln) amidotransferase A subunit family amidase